MHHFPLLHRKVLPIFEHLNRNLFLIFSSKSLSQLYGVSSRRVAALTAFGILLPEDLLRLRPHRYLDRSTIKFPREARESDTATFVGTIIDTGEVRNGRATRFECRISDGRAELRGVWFNGVSWIKKRLEKGQNIALFGQVRRFGRHLSIAHPDFEILEGLDDISSFSRIIPVYPSGKDLLQAGITSSLLSRWIADLHGASTFADPLPESIKQQRGLCGLEEAYRYLHRPETMDQPEKARRRLAFEELLLFQCALQKLRLVERTKAPGPVFQKSTPYTAAFFNQHLPFQLTEGQKSALAEIKKDVRTGLLMNRLVQGDVGAGKTVVAIGAMLMAIDNGYQAAMMAPTELLAEQHYRTISSLLAPLQLDVRLLTGSQSNAPRQETLSAVQRGDCNILVGTHALVEDTVRFQNLGLAVVDEQHRFGVAQRQALSEKGQRPHVLVMSATPIPRSLAMTVYGNLDVSVVSGLPSGRKPVVTMLLRESDRELMMKRLVEKLRNGEQAFVVFPLIEDSALIDLKSATYGFEQIQRRLPEFNVALLHGRMKRDERDQIMQAFKNREYQVLVSTTVIEVGIDVPNASTMIIEHAERFGLAQLHQLRGRVGRGTNASFCYLMAGKAVSEDGWQRLRMMEQTNDGFEIAEADLKIRGPGDFLGTKQSGLPDFAFADLIQDQLLLADARSTAEVIFREDPELNLPQHRVLKRSLEQYLKTRMHLLGA